MSLTTTDNISDILRTCSLEPRDVVKDQQPPSNQMGAPSNQLGTPSNPLGTSPYPVVTTTNHLTPVISQYSYTSPTLAYPPVTSPFSAPVTSFTPVTSPFTPSRITGGFPQWDYSNRGDYSSPAPPPHSPFVMTSQPQSPQQQGNPQQQDQYPISAAMSRLQHPY